MERRHGSEDAWNRLGELESGLGAPVVGAGSVVEDPERLIHRLAALECPTDEAIARAVKHLIEVHPAVVARDLTVAVECGTVTLRGEVEDDAMRVAAPELARTVPGVKGVVNHLKIEHSSLAVRARRW